MNTAPEIVQKEMMEDSTVFNLATVTLRNDSVGGG